MKSLLPNSLFGRAVTILLLPILLLQLVVGLVFFQRHYQRVTEQMTAMTARELSFVVAQAEAAEDAAAAAARLADLAGPLDFRLALRPGTAVAPEVVRVPFDLTGTVVAATLAEEIARPLRIDLADGSSAVTIAIPTRHGVLEAAVPRSRLAASNPHQLLVLMIVAAVLFSAVAVLFLRNQVRPIRQLAEAADAFGKGRSAPFRPAGAEEVRRAGRAFLAMRARLERQIEQRTQMLSGVSHDLRTPLTRMKLTLALMEDGEDTRGLSRDLDQMERMLGEFLAFARGAAAEEPAPSDPFRRAGGVAEDARRGGAAVDVVAENETPGDTLVPMRPGAVARALDNLLGNAARHGDRMRLTIRLTPRLLSFIVEDDGPGIPEAERARAVQPFSRLDEARNQDEGGSVGLGLTIAMDIARSHGGGLDLGESPDLGGLRATLRIPR